MKHNYDYQCCGAGAGGAEIIWGPGAGAGAENKFKKHFLQSVWRMLGRRKANFYSFIGQYIAVAGAGAGAEIMDKVGAVAKNK